MKNCLRTITAGLLAVSLLAAGGLGCGEAKTGGIAIAARAASGPAKAEAGPAGSQRVAENGSLALDFNPETAEIHVTDLSSGTVWSSNPDDLKDDKIAKGTKKMDLQAQLLVDYVDAQAKPFQLNNYTGSIKEKKFTWSKIVGGIEVTFQFPKAELAIPVSYKLAEDSFSAEISTGGITQGEKYKLVNISLLPYFGAGSLKDEGYLFVPDGSGALIHFNNGKAIYKSYNDRVYGGDKALTLSHSSEVKEDIKLPVYGLRKNGHAFLAVIEEGVYQAGIAAEVSFKSNQYNSVHSYFNAVESESNLIMEGTANEKQVLRLSESQVEGTPFKVRYYFLNGEAADYSGMAVKYREYLTKQQGVTAKDGEVKEQIPLLLDLLGGVEKRKTFLGIPYKTVEALTTYKEVQAVADRLQKDGLNNLAIRYEGWMKGGALGKVSTSVKAESNLGGKKQFTRLAASLKAQGVAFYPAVNPVEFHEGGNGFYKFFDVAKGISRGPALQYEFRLSDGTKDPDRSPWYLLKPESVKESLKKFTAAAADKGLEHVALQGIGSTVYSDFRKHSLSKNSVGAVWEEGLKSAQGQVQGLMFNHASAYTFPYAETLSDVPLYSSGYDLEDAAVPFYSIAVSGLLPAFSEPVNLSGDSARYMLKLIETGTYPAYRFIAGHASQLKGTDFDNLYSAEFGLWADEVVKQYTDLNKALAQVSGHPITGHERLSEGVYRTVFSGGITVIVNYTDEAVTVDGSRVAGLGYLVQSGGEHP